MLDERGVMGTAPPDVCHPKDVAPVSRCVELYRSDPDMQELEVRIGTFEQGKFRPGIEREDFDNLVCDMIACGYHDSGKWEEHVDYHYTTRSGSVRTRVTFDSSNMAVFTEHVQKQTRLDTTFIHVRENAAFRVSVAHERPVKDPPEACIPTCVRIKQRRTFSDVREGLVIWKYEFSKSWTAPSRSAAEHQQHMSPPVFEVECELVDKGRAYTRFHTSDYIAESLMLKSQLLLGEGDRELTSFRWQAVCDEGKGRKSTKRKAHDAALADRCV